MNFSLLEIVSDIEIGATPEKIWSVLTDFPSFPEWNPFVRSIEGAPRKGEQLRVTIQPPGGREMKFTPKVLKAEPGRELRGLGHFIMPGLFDGEHYFQLTETEPGRCRLVHGASRASSFPSPGKASRAARARASSR